MLPIILNNLFTRHRKEMAEAEKARQEARRNQRIVTRAPEADLRIEDEKQAEAQPQADKPEKG